MNSPERRPSISRILHTMSGYIEINGSILPGTNENNLFIASLKFSCPLLSAEFAPLGLARKTAFNGQLPITSCALQMAHHSSTTFQVVSDYDQGYLKLSPNQVSAPLAWRVKRYFENLSMIFAQRHIILAGAAFPLSLKTR